MTDKLQSARGGTAGTFKEKEQFPYNKVTNLLMHKEEQLRGIDSK